MSPKNEIVAGFTIERSESLLFAELSGDFNPLHIDAGIASRSRFGGTVVHGVHAFLRAFETVLDGIGKPVLFRSLRLTFHDPVPTGALVTSGLSLTGAKHSLRLFSNGKTVQQNTFKLADYEGDATIAAVPRPFRRNPAELSFEDCAAVAGSVSTGFDAGLAKRLFPSASRWLQPAQLGTILALSRIAGMECPGLHSLLFKCEGEFIQGESDSALAFRVVETDDRFAMVYIDVHSGLFRGRIQAMLRTTSKSRSAVPLT